MTCQLKNRYHDSMKSDDHWLSREIIDRFLRYVKIETTSDRHQTTTPSTECQWDLLHLLKEELEEIGIRDVQLDKHGYLIGRIPSNIQGVSQPPVIGFMAHVDTSEDVSGKGVKPQLHEDYKGGVIKLKNGVQIDPEEFQLLKNSNSNLYLNYAFKANSLYRVEIKSINDIEISDNKNVSVANDFRLVNLYPNPSDGNVYLKLILKTSLHLS